RQGRQTLSDACTTMSKCAGLLLACVIALTIAPPAIAAEMEPGVWRGTLYFPESRCRNDIVRERKWGATLQIDSAFDKLPRGTFIVETTDRAVFPISKIEREGDVFEVTAAQTFDSYILRKLKIDGDQLTGDVTFNSDFSCAHRTDGRLSLTRVRS